MRRIVLMSLAAVAALGATNAQAQGRYYGYDRDDGEYQGYSHYDEHRWRVHQDTIRRARYMCTGGRAHDLEARIEHERREGDLDGYSARDLHRRVDWLEYRQRDACGRSDWYSMNSLQARYDEIERELRYGRG